MSAFHCVQRTVRRAWIQDRLAELAGSFGIDCLSFCVMVNHIHVILRNRPDVVAEWSDEEVAKRWWQLFPLRKNKDKSPAIPTEDELKLFMSPARSKQLRSSKRIYVCPTQNLFAPSEVFAYTQIRAVSLGFPAEVRRACESLEIFSKCNGSSRVV